MPHSLDEPPRSKVLLGSSSVMQELRETIATVARVPWPALVEGPPGSGKRIAGWLLHQWSPWAAGPYLRRSVHMLPDELALSELVGHSRGAFTGAIRDRVGSLELAHRGSLFLDEIADASPRVQGVLLDLVEERVFTRLGEERVRRADVRLIVATNVDLAARVAAERFRVDLYDRLGVLVVRMPALAEHIDDVPEIAADLLGRKCEEAGVGEVPLAAPSLDRLMEYAWPGNVRELEKAIEHYVTYRRLPAWIGGIVRLAPWRDRLDESLRRHGGNKSAAARELGVSRKALHAELRRRTADQSASP